jgi:hypothetical protein
LIQIPKRLIKSIARIREHSQAATTHRYAHLDADPLRRAADTIGATISAAMGGGKAENVVASCVFSIIEFCPLDRLASRQAEAHHLVPCFPLMLADARDGEESEGHRLSRRAWVSYLDPDR